MIELNTITTGTDPQRGRGPSDSDEQEDQWSQLKDVLPQIFSYLAEPRHLLTLAKVCRRWNTVSSDNTLWKSAIRKVWPHLVRETPDHTDYKKLYLFHRQCLKNCFMKGELARNASQRIRGLTHVSKIQRDQIVAATEQGTLAVIDCRTGAVEREIKPPLPFDSDHFYINDLALFESHFTLHIRTSHQGNMIQAIVAIDSVDGQLLSYYELPSDAKRIKIEEETVYYKDHNCLQEVNYWTAYPKTLLEGLTPATSPLFSHPNSPLIAGDKAFVQVEDENIHVFSLESGVLTQTIPAKGELLEACDGIVYTCHNDYTLYMWNPENGKLLASLCLEPHLREDYRLKVEGIRISGDVLCLNVSYKFWFNAQGKIVPNSYNSFEASENSLLFYNKKNLKFLRAIDFDHSISRHFTFKNGFLTVLNTDTGEFYDDKLKIFDFTQPPVKKKMKFCAIQ